MPRGQEQGPTASQIVAHYEAQQIADVDRHNAEQAELLRRSLSRRYGG